MAGLIHLELLTDFFNKIGPARHVVLKPEGAPFYEDNTPLPSLFAGFVKSFTPPGDV